MRRLLLYLSLDLLLLVACTVKPDYGAFVSVPTDAWSDASPVVFEVDTLPPGDYNIDLAVLSSAAHSFPYHKLTLLLHQEWNGASDSTGNGFSVSTDTLLPLPVYDREGDPKGDGLSLRQHEIPAGYIHLSDSAAGRIVVNHHMRGGEVQGIASVGILLKKR